MSTQMWRKSDGSLTSDAMEARSSYTSDPFISLVGMEGLLSFYGYNQQHFESPEDALKKYGRVSSGNSGPAPIQNALGQTDAASPVSQPGATSAVPSSTAPATAAASPSTEGQAIALSPFVDGDDRIPSGGARDPDGNVYYPDYRRAPWKGPKGKPHRWDSFFKQKQQHEEQSAFSNSFTKEQKALTPDYPETQTGAITVKR